jgi:hypothetical protein
MCYPILIVQYIPYTPTEFYQKIAYRTKSMRDNSSNMNFKEVGLEKV